MGMQHFPHCVYNDANYTSTNAQKEIAVLKNWISLRFGNDLMQVSFPIKSDAFG
jgi:hypothetical protein